MWRGPAIALVAALVMQSGAAPTAAPPACPGQDVPPAPPAIAELAAPAPTPLPVPADPVGGLDGCGDAGPTVPPQVTAPSFVLADLDSGAVLAARAPHARHRPASAIKVLTALVAIRELDPDAGVDGIPADVTIEGSRAGIGPGTRYPVRLLLAGLLLNSGEDTAAALARAIGGDAAMVSAMASTARELGALDTRPVTPSGLDGPGGASSAYDLALLFRAALREPLFASTIATRSVPFPGYADLPGFELYNSSRFLARYPGALGGKAGFTDAARHTLVAAAERDGRRLVVALMRGEQGPVPVWQQAAALLDLGFAQPADVTPVGELVDGAPDPTSPTDDASPGPASPSPASPSSASPGPASPGPAPPRAAPPSAAPPSAAPGDPADGTAPDVAVLTAAVLIVLAAGVATWAAVRARRRGR